MKKLLILGVLCLFSSNGFAVATCPEGTLDDAQSDDYMHDNINSSPSCTETGVGTGCFTCANGSIASLSNIQSLRQRGLKVKVKELKSREGIKAKAVKRSR